VDPPVVALVDEVERRPVDVVRGAPGSIEMNQFGFAEAVESFGENIIGVVTFGPDRGDDVGLAEAHSE
jgi:hypothetical protein